ncbi:MAG: glycosyltransferase [Fibromonadaceae bacterium]|jgi:glycosyltransferase involved in cell wall biosynthesis|nr:glycosyltransferase [Fibromonadaceae bacterium]
MNSLVSVILPVRNGENYIRAAIDSVLAQTYPHFELVVVDASDDNTPNIVASYKDERIKYFRQKSKGSVNGYNEALDNYVNGKYITFIHHDDIYYREKLYEQVRMIEKFADVDCVYNDIEFVDEQLNTVRIRGHEDYYHRNNDLLAVMMIGYGISNLGMNVLVKRDFIEKHKLRYSLETPICCDHAYMFDLIDAGATFKHIDKPLLRYRVHEDNYSGDRERVEQDNQRIYARYSFEKLENIVKHTNYSENEKEIVLGKLYYRLGNTDKANKLFIDALNKHQNPWAAFYLGTGYYRYQGNFESAEKYLRLGQEQMPYRAEFANNIGCCVLQQQNVDAAKPYFAEAARLMPNYYDAKYNLERSEIGEKFNPRITDREIEHSEQFGIVWKMAEKKREESGSLQPAGNL